MTLSGVTGRVFDAFKDGDILKVNGKSFKVVRKYIDFLDGDGFEIDLVRHKAK